MNTLNDWCTWHYDEGKLRYEYAKYEGPTLSFHDALVENAKSIIDTFPGEPLSLMFSGGVDSELMLRAFIEVGHPFTVNVFRYDQNYNQYDVDFALKICGELNVSPKIIDINATHFYEHDAWDLSNKIKTGHFRALIQSTFVDYVDGIALYGTGDPRFYRPVDSYEEKVEWLVQDNEYETAWVNYAEDRKSIMWLRWHPAVISSMMQLGWFRRLINDEYFGKLGVNSTKVIGYRDAYPDLASRIKKTGFEEMDHLVLPLQTKHDEIYGDSRRQTAEMTVSELERKLWGTSENF